MSSLLVVDVGEFGWTLCSLVPRARKMARGFDRVTVATHRSRFPAFEFADEFLPLEYEPNTQDFLTGDLTFRSSQALGHAEASVDKAWPTPRERRVIMFEERAAFDSGTRCDTDKEWLAMGQPPVVGIDACLAFRPPKEYRGRVQAYKAWPREECDALAALLGAEGLRLACIGGPDNYLADGCPTMLDLRGAALGLQVDFIAGAKLCVGPSSAPMHLASLCKTPHVTWYGAPAGQVASSKSRYRSSWNPFGTPCHYLDGVPSAEMVGELVLQLVGKA